MIANIIAQLSAFIISVISTLGYPGIVLLMAIESACIPLPSEVIMPFSGALTIGSIAAQYNREPFTLVLVALFGAVGCNVGSVVAYEIGYYGGRPLVQKFGAYILLSQKELDWADHFFERYGDWTVFVSRLLPVVRTFIALPAGIARMPRLRFHVFTFLGSFPWCLMLAYVGMKLGEKWETDPRLKIWFHRFDAIILAVIVITVVVFVWSRWQHRMRAAAPEA